MKRTFVTGIVAGALSMVAALGLSLSVALAQLQGNPFTTLWPFLEPMAGEIAATARLDGLGNRTGDVYFRLGFGSCLRVNVGEVAEFFDQVPANRYQDVMTHALSQHEGEFSQADYAYCPPAPRVVKSSFWGSRPVYDINIGDDGVWRRGRKTGWRVVADGETVIPCVSGVIRRGDKLSSYRRLGPDAVVYSDTLELRVDSMDNVYQHGLAVVCEQTNESIFDIELAPQS